jgi:hypothetical protein
LVGREYSVNTTDPHYHHADELHWFSLWTETQTAQTATETNEGDCSIIESDKVAAVYSAERQNRKLVQFSLFSFYFQKIIEISIRITRAAHPS